MHITVDQPPEPNKSWAAVTHWVHHVVCPEVPQGKETMQANTGKYTWTSKREIRAECQTCSWSPRVMYPSFYIQTCSHLCHRYILLSLRCHLYIRV